MNFKTEPPARVRLERLERRRLDLSEVLAGAPELPRAAAPATVGREVDPSDPLRALDPVIYVEALTGQTVGRSRKVSCPIHTDTTPSLHVYETAEGGWYCFGCRRGTSVYDLARPLWGLQTRGREFIELRRRLLLSGMATPQTTGAAVRRAGGDKPLKPKVRRLGVSAT